ncbi:MAG: hypothetical protein U5J63_02990 [Fodinibius sp.]|nr:hypothetical protein [Fodinibius sp.]
MSLMSKAAPASPHHRCDGNGVTRPGNHINPTGKSGEVIDLLTNFMPGGYVQKGDTLLRQINPEDYQLQLRQRKSNSSQAESDLTLEVGHAAGRPKRSTNYTAIPFPFASQPGARTSRATVKSSRSEEVQAAEAAVERAKLDLAAHNYYGPLCRLIFLIGT